LLVVIIYNNLRFKCKGLTTCCNVNFSRQFERIKSQNSFASIIECSHVVMDVHVGKVGAKNGDALQFTSFSELDVEREINKENILQVESSVMQVYCF